MHIHTYLYIYIHNWLCRYIQYTHDENFTKRMMNAHSTGSQTLFFHGQPSMGFPPRSCQKHSARKLSFVSTQHWVRLISNLNFRSTLTLQISTTHFTYHPRSGSITSIFIWKVIHVSTFQRGRE